MGNKKYIDSVEQCKQDFFSQGCRFSYILSGKSDDFEKTVWEAYELILLDDNSSLSSDLSFDYKSRENKVLLFKTIYTILSLKERIQSKCDFHERWPTFYELSLIERSICYLKFRENLTLDEMIEIFEKRYWSLLLDYFNVREKLSKSIKTLKDSDSCERQRVTRLFALGVLKGSTNISQIKEHMGYCEVCQNEFSSVSDCSIEINQQIPTVTIPDDRLEELLLKAEGPKTSIYKNFVSNFSSYFR